MGDVVLLRTLTKKSILWFGKYNGMTIQQILDLHQNSYLRYIYYNISTINYCNEILDEITIRDERVIKKPGTAPEMHNGICKENLKTLSSESEARYKKIDKVKKKIMTAKTNRYAVIRKDVLRSYNHGNNY